MKLTAYVLDGHTINIRPAPFERDWMDGTDQHYAYRCLPLSIANAHGWEILCETGFTAEWNGGRGLDAVKVTPDAGGQAVALSHFGNGILTFHVPCLFRTETGYDLWVTGPINRPKDGIAPLSGVVETDWSPYSFTMNWQFTRAMAIRFEKGEPFCHLMPLRRGEIETVDPELRMLSDNSELKRQHELWVGSRSHFLDDLQHPDSDARSEKWQKRYFQGLQPDHGSVEAVGHRTRLKVKPFSKRK